MIIQLRLTFSRNTTSPIAHGIQVQTIPISANAKFNRNKFSGLLSDRFQQMTIRIKEFRMIANIVTKAIRIPTTVLSRAIFMAKQFFCSLIGVEFTLIHSLRITSRPKSSFRPVSAVDIIAKVFQCKEAAQKFLCYDTIWVHQATGRSVKNLSRVQRIL